MDCQEEPTKNGDEPSEELPTDEEDTPSRKRKKGGFLCPERGCREVFPLAGHPDLYRAEHREAAVSCRECGRAFGAQLDMLLHRLDCEKRLSKLEETS